MNAEPVVIEGLVKDYQGLRPLRLKHLVVRRGERVSLSGVDAVAAEVLINIVNGAILPDEGEVRIFGRATTSIADEAEWFATLDRFGIVTPRAVLLESSTVRQNLALPFTIAIDELEADVRMKTTALAAEVGLAETLLEMPVAGVPPHDRLRIHLARAIATSPDVLLLEHPTAGVARDEVAPFAGVLAGIVQRRGLTLLALTEDTALVEGLSSTHYRLQGGTGALVSARGWRRWF